VNQFQHINYKDHKENHIHRGPKDGTAGKQVNSRDSIATRYVNMRSMHRIPHGYNMLLRC